MNLHRIQYNLPQTNRFTMRKDLIYKMLEEEPGTGKGNACSRYEYIVEEYNNTYIIFLKRPTRLNKGFDFTVNIQGLWFKKQRQYYCPSHNDIFEILEYCKNSYSQRYQIISNIIEDIFYCNPINLSTRLNIFFYDFNGNKHPIEIILLTIKWLFIKQDCAYWNYSGRQMLFQELKDRNLV